MLNRVVGISGLGTPTAGSRLLCACYEFCLLFAVTFVSGYLFLSLLQWQWPLSPLRLMAYQGWMFWVIGSYFVWFWRHGGQTLAMKTWKIRLVSTRAGGLSMLQSLTRYALLWIGLVPAAIIAGVYPEHSQRAVAVWLAIQLLCFGWMFIDRDRQFLHDRLSGTRLVSA
jgi:uncharacterized RDD family membrane protein YckC